MTLDALADRLRAAARITILTGAGVSAASGVPTFRGPEGLWRTYRPEDLATPAAFRRDPRLVWEWYAWRREKIAGCRPNAAHDVIARWSVRRPGPAEAGHYDRWCTVITQNVDDLHVRAGTERLIRLHGSIWELKCTGGSEEQDALYGTGCPAWRDERVPFVDFPPKCRQCGSLARPAVVWFGESLSPGDLEAALQACRCDLFLMVGTSAVVYPAAGLVHEAARHGAFTVEINAEPTAASTVVDLAIHGAAEQILPAVDRLV